MQDESTIDIVVKNKITRIITKKLNELRETRHSISGILVLEEILDEIKKEEK